MLETTEDRWIREDIERDVRTTCLDLGSRLQDAHGRGSAEIVAGLVWIAKRAVEEVVDLPMTPPSIGRLMCLLAGRENLVKGAHRLFALARLWADYLGPLDAFGAESFVAIAQAVARGFDEDEGAWPLAGPCPGASLL